MKTSTKLILTALAVFTGMLIAYNVALTAAYKEGEFRNPFNDFTTLENKAFNAVTVNAANMISVEIVPGDYQVRVHKESAEYVKVVQRGNELIVDVANPDENLKRGSGMQVIISCPDLAILKTNARYTFAGKEQVDLVVPDRTYLRTNVVVKNMELDSLSIVQDNASSVVLEGNKIGQLQAVVGVSTGSGPKLYLKKENMIPRATLDIRHNSLLVLEDVALPNLTYTFSEQAKTIISGASLAALKSN